ncbi:hypothetical protein [Pararhodobacter sp.]|uniref:hypothetical protein n=1 Tax=Pararhodobacter sp. TaxID=2127056 RepID=UPI002AFE7FD4|nr:hypothetical protein [Pararhodobacter sp.]
MDKTARDALAETRDVLNGLSHFLGAVGRATRSDASADLKAIEISLTRISDQIAAINQRDSQQCLDAAPFLAHAQHS